MEIYSMASLFYAKLDPDGVAGDKHRGRKSHAFDDGFVTEISTDVSTILPLQVNNSLFSGSFEQPSRYHRHLLQCQQIWKNTF